MGIKSAFKSVASKAVSVAKTAVKATPAAKVVTAVAKAVTTQASKAAVLKAAPQAIVNKPKTAGEIVIAARAESKRTGENEMSIIARNSQNQATATPASSSTPKSGGGGSLPSVFTVNPIIQAANNYGFSSKDPYLNYTPVSSGNVEDIPTYINFGVGKLTGVTHRVISGDELQVNVSVVNDSENTQEYRAYLYTSSGERVDKEPDTYFKNVGVNSSATFVLNSKWKNFDVGSMGGSYTVSVMTQAGILVGERVVSLYSGEVTKGREDGGLIKPDTAPPTNVTPETPSGGFDTPAIPTSGGSTDWGRTAIIVAAIVGAAYFLGGKK